MIATKSVSVTCGSLLVNYCKYRKVKMVFLGVTVKGIEIVNDYTFNN